MTGPGAGEMLEGVQALALLLAVALGAGCSFDASGTSGAPADGGGPIDGGGAIDAAADVDGGFKSDADVALSEFCQGAGLEACYELEGNLVDGSTNTNDLTGTNVGYDTGEGGDDQALKTTQSSKVDAIKSATLDFTDELTIEAWLMPDQVQDRWAIDHQGQWGLVIDDDRIGCVVVTLDEGGGSTGHFLYSNAASVPQDLWTHVACTYDGSIQVLYVQGAVAASTALTGAIDVAPTGGFTVGRDSPLGSAWLGLIDDVRIWSVARKASELFPD